MRTRTIVVAAALTLTCLAVCATEWEETDWGTEIVVDARTGLPAVVFYVSLEVPAPPDGRPISTSWEVYEVVGGVEVALGGFSRTAIRSGESTRIYAASPAVPIVAGGRYGGRITITDADSISVHARTFDFTAPAALPFGIRLPGWDGSENVDLGELPDEELEELVLLHDLLGRYEKGAERLTVDAFLRGDAATSAYPLSLLILPTAQIDTSDVPITMFVVLTLYVYTLTDPGEVAGVRGQIDPFEQEMIGAVYAGAGDTILGGGVTIFVQDSVWALLDAAAARFGGG